MVEFALENVSIVISLFFHIILIMKFIKQIIVVLKYFNAVY